MATSKEVLYANRISKRAITILDVPDEHREAVLSLLSESDKKRQEAFLDEGR